MKMYVDRYMYVCEDSTQLSGVGELSTCSLQGQQFLLLQRSLLVSVTWCSSECVQIQHQTLARSKAYNEADRSYIDYGCPFQGNRSGTGSVAANIGSGLGLPRSSARIAEVSQSVRRQTICLFQQLASVVPQWCSSAKIIVLLIMKALDNDRYGSWRPLTNLTQTF